MTQIIPVKDRIAKIKGEIEGRRSQIEVSLPDKGIGADRLIRVALTTILRSPKLLGCTASSIVAATLDCAQLGLVPDSSGEAWLIPFWNKKIRADECKMLPGYQGLLKLAWQSSLVKGIDCQLVHEKDAFSYQMGTAPEIRHVPCRDSNRGGISHVYAIGWLTTGMTQFQVMTTDEVNQIMARSRSKDVGPWVTDWGWMARKTVLKRLCKLLPRSTRLQRALAMDDQRELGLEETAGAEAVEVIEAEREPEQDAKITEAQHRAIMAGYRELGIEDDLRHKHLESLTGRSSVTELTSEQAGKVLRSLEDSRREPLDDPQE